jgi:hypothetical protein
LVSSYSMEPNAWENVLRELMAGSRRKRNSVVFTSSIKPSDWASTIIGTKTYAKRQLPKRALPVPQEREEGGVPPSGSNR